MRLVKSRVMKILDFDIENRPLSYWYDGQTTAEITAIASCWVGYPSTMRVDVITAMDATTGGRDSLYMLEEFVKRYDEADVVTGHYIRKHDLPHINMSLMDLGLSPLKPKLTHDTKLDMVKKASIPATQEHLAEMLGLEYPKVHMTQEDWREANRLTPAGIEKTKKRVTGDVLQHMALRLAMLEAGLLKEPKIWRS